MITPELLEYMRKALAASLAKDDIIKTLIAQGWSVQDINDALFQVNAALAAEQALSSRNYAGSRMSPLASPTESEPQKESGRGFYAAVTILCVIGVLVAIGIFFAYHEKLGPFAGG